MFSSYFTGSIAKSTRQLINTLRDDSASQTKINKAWQSFVAATKHAKTKEVEEAIDSLASLISFENLNQAAVITLICGNLFEFGYRSIKYSFILLNYCKQVFEIAMPSLQFLKETAESINAQDEDDNGEYDEYAALAVIKEDRKKTHPREMIAVEVLDKYYPGVIAVFSSMPELIPSARNEMNGISLYTEINEGCYWISTLLSVLINEPLLVINTTNNTGIIAEMSGVADNAQLQLLLMGMHELKPLQMLEDKYLKIVRGEGEQTINTSIIGLWNLNNWEILRFETEDINTNINKYNKYWIWSEGTPANIAVYDNYRVVVLTKAPFKRSLQIQRSFKALKSSIQVKQILLEGEVLEWIRKMKTTTF